MKTQDVAESVRYTATRIVLFLVLAYLWSWAWWIPVIVALRGKIDLSSLPAWVVPCVLIGGYGPGVSAVFFTAYHTGRKGLKSLFARFLFWRASVWIHLFIWFGPPLCIVLAMALDPQSTRMLGTPQWGGIFLVPMVIFSGVIFGPLGEELGWRGYALPILQKKHSALISSLIIGVAWCFWHAPLFWAPGGTTLSGHDVTFAAVGKYLLSTCGLAIIFTWIFNNSKGSVLLAVAFHASANSAVPMLLFPAADSDATLAIGWLSIIPYWAFALVLIATLGGQNLSKTNRSNVAQANE